MDRAIGKQHLGVPHGDHGSSGTVNYTELRLAGHVLCKIIDEHAGAWLGDNVRVNESMASSTWVMPPAATL